jgi:hypothetical protein
VPKYRRRRLRIVSVILLLPTTASSFHGRRRATGPTVWIHTRIFALCRHGRAPIHSNPNCFWHLPSGHGKKLADHYRALNFHSTLYYIVFLLLTVTYIGMFQRSHGGRHAGQSQERPRSTSTWLDLHRTEPNGGPTRHFYLVAYLMDQSPKCLAVSLSRPTIRKSRPSLATAKCGVSYGGGAIEYDGGHRKIGRPNRRSSSSGWCWCWVGATCAGAACAVGGGAGAAGGGKGGLLFCRTAGTERFGAQF